MNTKNRDKEIRSKKCREYSGDEENISYWKVEYPPVFREAADYLVENLNGDPRFLKCLEKTCEMNYVNLEAVKKCIGGLYQISSNDIYDYGNITIYAKDWVVNEIIALSLIFKYFGIPFRYLNENRQEVNFPYEISSEPF
ncbi:7838_t:CDS:2 [Scutellospora calospora]|uniref:7838_t:CDS:1 n=1 Tax=Scutellospora calospora TaxID=85575 RepID=A0ACA9JTT4_9GLOM|nr:7838_t:CDS:2 [Scutellospora calospora]